jgi:hypothetical protein
MQKVRGSSPRRSTILASVVSQVDRLIAGTPDRIYVSVELLALRGVAGA